jgi:hypothetical protein
VLKLLLGQDIFNDKELRSCKLGVGKTSLAHLISQGQPITGGSPSWTVGCSVEVKLHEFREGTPGQRPYFVELWDVGGSSSHRNARWVFYNPTQGTEMIIIIYIQITAYLSAI